VTILCNEEGHHNLQETKFYTFKNEEELSLLLDRCSDDNTLAFGDFYIARALVSTKLPYFFVYHDNYPELKDLGVTSNTVDDKMISTYGSIFSRANYVFSVSDYKLDFIKQFTSKVSVVRNGLSQKVSKLSQRVKHNNTLKVLMAGNIDHRKYKKAIEVFGFLEGLEVKGIDIHIYGRSLDDSIRRGLDKFDFVQYGGYKKEISYDDYDVYLSTSLIENLSLSVVDALANKTPVVSFDVGGIQELIVSNQNGVVIPAYDAQEMARTLVSLKEHGFTFEMNEHALDPFNWTSTAEKMLSIMCESLAN